MSTQICAGFATVALPTPPRGYLAGYAVADRYAEGTQEALTATVARLEARTDGRIAQTLVWIGIDALAISDPLRAAVAAAIDRLLPDAETLVSATHTHSAPGAWCGTIHPILPAEIDEAQIARVARCIGQALPATLPVELSHGTAPVTGVGANRHDPARPADTSVSVLAARHAGRLTGLLVNHACHPTVLGCQNRLWSPDWVAGLRTGVAEAVGPDLPVLFLQGAAGDISTRFTRRESTAAEAQRLGSTVAAGVLAALRTATAVDPSTGLGVERHRLTLHRRDAARELVLLGGSAHNDAAPGGDLEEPLPGQASDTRGGVAGLRALAAHPGPSHREVPVADVHVGAVRYLTTPIALQNAWGTRLCAAGDLRVVGYTDAYLGYLSDTAAHAEGVYEATSSLADAAESETLMSQLTDIAARRRR